MYGWPEIETPSMLFESSLSYRASLVRCISLVWFEDCYTMFIQCAHSARHKLLVQREEAATEFVAVASYCGFQKHMFLTFQNTPNISFLWIIELSRFYTVILLSITCQNTESAQDDVDEIFSFDKTMKFGLVWIDFCLVTYKPKVIN